MFRDERKESQRSIFDLTNLGNPKGFPKMIKVA
ncbi:hypothetical protein P872_15520 [Rhodonellum psychrophilum GCM71 = DSM 17998]|uniref:Uncharacterized protein n=1 Tax=Rhodonellum psychrophilum GCM71 = DSM 17998 TaxID=1123057 RepID=U5C5I2_9BACT|nr:hypothetical protein P872_15520 [Rhodonellum psychrophilum GCM71 = DSM 17998]